MDETVIKDKKFYNVKDIQRILGIGRNRAYDYLKMVYESGEPFRVVKIGNLYKIPIISFDKWIDKISE